MNTQGAIDKLADGSKLLGDLAGVPAKLADIMASAYRRRSIEMSFGDCLNAPTRTALAGAEAVILSFDLALAPQDDSQENAKRMRTAGR